MSWSPNGWSDSLARLLGFTAELDRRRVHYTLASYRRDALMVLVSVPGERWEIEVMADDTIDVERFHSSGDISGGEELDQLWELCDERNAADTEDAT